MFQPEIRDHLLSCVHGVLQFKTLALFGSSLGVLSCTLARDIFFPAVAAHALLILLLERSRLLQFLCCLFIEFLPPTVWLAFEGYSTLEHGLLKLVCLRFFLRAVLVRQQRNMLRWPWMGQTCGCMFRFLCSKHCP